MKHITAILCTAMICATWLYSSYTRPGRYYFPKTWYNERATDTATGKMYFFNDAEKNWHSADPLGLSSITEKTKTIIDNPFKIPETSGAKTNGFLGPDAVPAGTIVDNPFSTPDYTKMTDAELDAELARTEENPQQKNRTK